MEIKIIFATPEDFSEVQYLNSLLFKEEKEKYDPTANTNWPHEEIGQKYYKDRLENEKSCVLIAKVKDQIVGYLIGFIREPEDYRTLKNQAELENMFVLSDFRHQKVGFKLVKRFFDWAKEKDIENTMVVASASNQGAINFYRSCGFQDYVHTLEINF